MSRLVDVLTTGRLKDNKIVEVDGAMIDWLEKIDKEEKDGIGYSRIELIGILNGNYTLIETEETK